jgi:hypothetical protein
VNNINEHSEESKRQKDSAQLRIENSSGERNELGELQRETEDGKREANYEERKHEKM